MSATDNGLRKISIAMDDELRDAVRRWQLQTASESAWFPASTIILTQVTEVLRDEHRAELPELRPQRHSASPVASSEMTAIWRRENLTWKKSAKIEVQMNADTMRALITVARKSRTFPTPGMLRDMVLSRLDKPLPACLLYVPTRRRRKRAARSEQHALECDMDESCTCGATTASADYAERFITLCRERAARDAWHRHGGVEPKSTVDDHLGRRVYGYQAEAAGRRRRQATV